MRDARRCLLTTRDFSILHSILEQNGRRGDPIMPMIRRKLSRADVVFPEDIDARVVTLNSRVEFQINDGPFDTRVVVHGDENSLVGMTIPVAIPRGLALLGLAERQEAVVDGFGGRPERIYVHRVAFQPEAAARAKATKMPVHERSDDTPGGSTFESKSTGPTEVLDFAARRNGRRASAAGSRDPGNHGPGPTAA